MGPNDASRCLGSGKFFFLFIYSVTILIYLFFCILDISTTTNEIGHITEGWERDSPGKQVGPNDASRCLGSGK